MSRANLDIKNAHSQKEKNKENKIKKPAEENRASQLQKATVATHKLQKRFSKMKPLRM
jgi:hypothetical protein